MSDTFTWCGGCGQQNTFIEIQALYPKAVTKKEKEVLRDKRLCLNCFLVQDKNKIMRTEGQR